MKKQFHGIMRITPKCNVAPFEIKSTWTYNEEFNLWYGGGRSFGADICEIISET